MTDMDTFTPVPAQAATLPTGGQLRLVEWANEARAAAALAQSLAQTPFAAQFQGDPLGATAAILKGSELGLTPVTSLGAFDKIQGVVAPKAMTMRALVQSRGHSVWIELSTPSRCVAKARRHGESIEHVSEWTIDRATQLGVTGKQNWRNQPQAMLVARATSEVCRMVASDVLLGIAYSAEEIGDDSPPPPTRGLTRAGPAKVSRRAAEAALAAPPPEPDVQPATAGPGPDPDDRITDAQRAAIFAAFRDANFTVDARTDKGRRVRLDYIAKVLGGEVVDSTADLTREQASRVIDALRFDTAAAGGAQGPAVEEPSIDEEPGQ